MTRPGLVSTSLDAPSSSWTPVAGANPDFNSLRRECGTAPGGATRSPRPKAYAGDAGERKKAVADLLKDEAWFADADSPLDNDLLDDCPSPTLFLSEPSPSLFGDMGMATYVFDAADPADSSGDVDAEIAAGAAAASDARQHPPVPVPSTGSGGGPNEGSDKGATPRSGSGRSRVEGGMNLSPRGSFERAKKNSKGSRTQNGNAHGGREPESSVLKGLLNSAEMEDRLAAAQQAREEPKHPNLRLMIPSPNVDLSLQLERPPSRQRNLPMHLNSDPLLELPSQDGQISPDVERKWAHYASTPRPPSRHKSPPDAVVLDLPPEPLQGDLDPQPLPPDEPLQNPPSPASERRRQGADGAASVTDERRGSWPHGAFHSADADATLPPSMPPKPSSASASGSSSSSGGGGGGGGASSYCRADEHGSYALLGPDPNALLPPPPQLLSTPMTVPVTTARPPARPTPSKNPPPTHSSSNGHLTSADRSAVPPVALQQASTAPLMHVGPIPPSANERDLGGHHPRPSRDSDLVAAEHIMPTAVNELHGPNSSATQPRGGGGAPPIADSNVFQPRSSSRPLTPTQNGRPASGPRATSVSGSPRGVRSPQLTEDKIRGLGHASHAHARALQQQAEAAATAAAAASARYNEINSALNSAAAAHSPSQGMHTGGQGGTNHSSSGPINTSTSSHGSGHTPIATPSAGMHRPSASRVYAANYSSSSGTGVHAGRAQPPSAASIASSKVSPTSPAPAGPGGGGPPNGPSSHARNTNEERLEVMSTASRPSTTDSEVSARGHASNMTRHQAARAQKISKLSTTYGNYGKAPYGAVAGGAYGAYGAYGVARPNRPSGPGRESARGGGSAGAAFGGGPLTGATYEHANMRPTGASSGASRSGAGSVRRVGGGTVTASGGASMGTVPPHPSSAGNPSMLRIPTELQPHAAAASGRDAGGIVSPLPFESSLAPDFLALFANSTFDHDQG